MSITKFRKSMTGWFKPILIGIAAIFVIGVFSFYGMYTSGGKSRDGAAPDIATIDGEGVPRTFYTKVMTDQAKKVEEMTGSRPTAAQTAMLKREILFRLIDLTLKRRAADQKGINVSSGDAAQQIEKIVGQEMSSARKLAMTYIRGKRKLTREEQDRNLELMLQRYYRRPDLTLETYRQERISSYDPEMMRADMMASKLDQQLRRGVRLTERELIDSYRNVLARRILLSTQARAEAQARAKADKVRKQAISGSDFAALAREFSDDFSSKRSGGAWPGALTVSTTRSMGIQPNVAKAIFALKPGEISDVIKVDNGFVIVKVDSETSTLPADFQAKKKQYMAKRLKEKQDEVVRDYYEQLQRKAKIEVLDADLKGYWLLQTVGAEFAAKGEAGAKNVLKRAARQFELALQGNDQDAASLFELVSLYQSLEQTDKAIAALARRMEIDATIEDAELRIMLGNLYAMKNDLRRALIQYKTASDESFDTQTHTQLVREYNAIGRKDLAAQEQKWIDEREAVKAMQGNTTGRNPTGGPR